MTVDIRLPEKYSKGSSGGPQFKTRKTPMDSGKVDRERRWARPLWQYEIAHNIKTPADMAAIRAFHLARGGSLESFLFLDQIDFASTISGDLTNGPISELDQPLGVGDGAETDFQLIKRYGDVGGQYDRNIEWPVAGTLIIAVDGVPLGSGFSVNRGTGIVTFSSPPANTAVLTAGFQFDVPVYFEEDLLSVTFDTNNSRSAGSIQLMEDRP